MHQHKLSDEEISELATKIINMINAMFGNMPRVRDMVQLPLAIAHGARWGTIVCDNGLLYTIELLSGEKQASAWLVMVVSLGHTHNWLKTRTLNMELLAFRNQHGLTYGQFDAAHQNVRPDGYSWA